MKCQHLVRMKNRSQRPCGQCAGCLHTRQQEIAALIQLEQTQAIAGAMLTLNYATRALPRTSTREIRTAIKPPSALAVFDYDLDPFNGEPLSKEERSHRTGLSILQKIKRIYGYQPARTLYADSALAIDRKDYQEACKTWAKNKRKRLYATTRCALQRNGVLDGLSHDKIREEVATRVDTKMRRWGMPTGIIINQSGAPTIHPGHITQFFKDLSKAIKSDLGTDNFEISYYYCAEYGAKKGRPHYHVAIFARQWPTELTNESFAEYLLGDHPNKGDNPGPMQRAWKHADWHEFSTEPNKPKKGKVDPEPSDYDRHSLPIEPGAAQYVAKYLMKGRYNFGSTENIENNKRCRVDGSVSEYGRSSRGKHIPESQRTDPNVKRTPSLGYTTIRHIARSRVNSAKTFTEMPRENLLHIFKAMAEANYAGSIPESLLTKLQEKGIPDEQIQAVADTVTHAAEGVPIMIGNPKGKHKLQTFRPNWHFRQKLKELVTIPEDREKLLKKIIEGVRAIHESRKADHELLEERRSSKEKAAKWKSGALT